MPITESEAITAVLYAFSRVRVLKENYTLKGGNALKLGHASPRSSSDLDFTVKGGVFTRDAAEHEKALGHFLSLFERGLRQAETRFGMVLGVSRSEIRPKRDPRTFPSFEVKVSYAELGPKKFFVTTVKLDISLNEIVCEDAEFILDDFAISVASLNDIVAEKLRSILQQVPRERSRPRDFYDIWYFATHHADKLDLEKIAAFLLEKSAGRGIPVSRAAFENPELLERGAIGFEKIRGTLPRDTRFPAFTAAAKAVLALVAQLDIPETHE